MTGARISFTLDDKGIDAEGQRGLREVLGQRAPHAEGKRFVRHHGKVEVRVAAGRALHGRTEGMDGHPWEVTAKDGPNDGQVGWCEVKHCAQPGR